MHSNYKLHHCHIKLDAVRSLRPNSQSYRSSKFIADTHGETTADSDVAFSRMYRNPVSTVESRVSLSTELYKHSGSTRHVLLSDSGLQSAESLSLSRTLMRPSEHIDMGAMLHGSQYAGSNKLFMSNEIITAVRVRPMLLSEKRSGCRRIVDMSSDETNSSLLSEQSYVRVTNPISLQQPIHHLKPNEAEFEGERLVENNQGLHLVSKYHFDHLFWSYDQSSGKEIATQQTIFDSLGVCAVDTALAGQNCLIFAHGQTSAGKTYTMLGGDRIKTMDATMLSSDSGLIPRICSELFNRLVNPNGMSLQPIIQLSYVEIYNERVYDLLGARYRHKPCLRIREHPDAGVFLENLHKEVAHSFEDAMRILADGNRKRCVAATGSNVRSSRSHAILTVHIYPTKKTCMKQSSLRVQRSTRCSAITLVDLAGSERIEVSQADGERLREAVMINRSLSALSDVIHAISRRTKAAHHIPFRNSTLTRLLQGKLRGDAKVIMLAAISPCCIHFEETIGTLKYISRARRDLKISQMSIPQHCEEANSSRQQLLNLHLKLRKNSQASLCSIESNTLVEAIHAESVPRCLSYSNDQGTNDTDIMIDALPPTGSNRQDMILLENQQTAAFNKNRNTVQCSKEVFKNISAQMKVRSLSILVLLLRGSIRKLNKRDAYNRMKMLVYKYNAQSEPETPEKDIDSFVADIQEERVFWQQSSNTGRPCTSKQTDLSCRKTKEYSCTTPASNQYICSDPHEDDVNLQLRHMLYEPSLATDHYMKKKSIMLHSVDEEAILPSMRMLGKKLNNYHKLNDKLAPPGLAGPSEKSTLTNTTDDQAINIRLAEFQKSLTNAHTHVDTLQTELNQVKNRLLEAERKSQHDLHCHQLSEESSAKQICCLKEKLFNANNKVEALTEIVKSTDMRKSELECNVRSAEAEAHNYKSELAKKDKEYSDLESRLVLEVAKNNDVSKDLEATRLIWGEVVSSLVVKLTMLSSTNSDHKHQMQIMKMMLEDKISGVKHTTEVEHNQHIQATDECIISDVSYVLGTAVYQCQQQPLLKDLHHFKERCKKLHAKVQMIEECMEARTNDLNMLQKENMETCNHLLQELAYKQQEIKQKDQQSRSFSNVCLSRIKEIKEQLMQEQNSRIECQNKLENLRESSKLASDRLQKDICAKELQQNMMNRQIKTLSRLFMRSLSTLHGAGRYFMREKYRCCELEKILWITRAKNDELIEKAQIQTLNLCRSQVSLADAESRCYYLADELNNAESEKKVLLSKFSSMVSSLNCRNLQLHVRLNTQKLHVSHTNRIVVRLENELVNVVATKVLDGLIDACDRGAFQQKMKDAEKKSSKNAPNMMMQKYCSSSSNKSCIVDRYRSLTCPAPEDSNANTDLVYRQLGGEGVLQRTAEDTNGIRVESIGTMCTVDYNVQDQRAMSNSTMHLMTTRNSFDTKSPSISFARRCVGEKMSILYERARYANMERTLMQVARSSEATIQKLKEDAVIVSSRLEFRLCDVESKCSSLMSQIFHLKTQMRDSTEYSIEVPGTVRKPTTQAACIKTGTVSTLLMEGHQNRQTRIPFPSWKNMREAPSAFLSRNDLTERGNEPRTSQTYYGARSFPGKVTDVRMIQTRTAMDPCSMMMKQHSLQLSCTNALSTSLNRGDQRPTKVEVSKEANSFLVPHTDSDDDNRTLQNNLHIVRHASTQTQVSMSESRSLSLNKIGLLKEDLIANTMRQSKLKDTVEQNEVEVQKLLEKSKDFFELERKLKIIYTIHRDEVCCLVSTNVIQESLLHHLKHSLSSHNIQKKLHIQNAQVKSTLLISARNELKVKGVKISELKEQLRRLKEISHDIERRYRELLERESEMLRRALERERNLQVQVDNASMLSEDLRGYIGRIPIDIVDDEMENRHMSKLDDWFEKNICSDEAIFGDDISNKPGQFLDKVPQDENEDWEKMTIDDTRKDGDDGRSKLEHEYEIAQLKSTISYLRETLSSREEIIAMLDERILFYEGDG